jgi:hypothetical protein
LLLLLLLLLLLRLLLLPRQRPMPGIPRGKTILVFVLAICRVVSLRWPSIDDCIRARFVSR